LQRSIIAPAERVTNERWVMVAIVAALVLAVSVDGVALVLGGWTDLDRVAFVAGMIVAQLPAGLLLDRYGVRAVGSGAGLVWILGALAAAFGGSSATVAASAVVGVASSAFLPLAIKATSAWFPSSERGRATAIVIAAADAPIVVTLSPFAPKITGGTPLLATIAFVVLVTIVFALAYRDADHPRVTHAERTFIATGGAQPVVVPPLGATFAQLVRQRSVWSFACAFGAFSFAFGIGAVQIWGLPLAGLALLVTLLIGGAQVDALARGGAESRTRTLVLVVGTLCGCASIGILGANVALGTACTAIALFGFAAAQPVAWSGPGLIAPRGAVGTLAAIVGLAGTIGAQLAWSAGPDMLGGAIAALIGAALFAFALDRIEPIPDPV
jgi:MFS family permease